eukprot:7256923-Alexandrium_andersonii.AAC.1
MPRFAGRLGARHRCLGVSGSLRLGLPQEHRQDPWGRRTSRDAPEAECRDRGVSNFGAGSQ